MKIEQVHVRHQTWHTRVTVGDKAFGLKRLDGTRHRVFATFGDGKTFEDFNSREAALDHCEGKQGQFPTDNDPED